LDDGRELRLGPARPVTLSQLRQVTPVDHTAVLRLLADRHHDLTGLRTQAICKLGG
jgi:hypothetical protein